MTATTSGAQDTQTDQGTGRRTAHLTVPGMSAEFHKPHLPSPNEMAHAAKSATSMLPPPGKLLFYGGLGAAAVLGVIDWPVAIAVGAGTVIAQRSRREKSGPQDRPLERSVPEVGDLGDPTTEAGLGTPSEATAFTGVGTPSETIADTGLGMPAERTAPTGSGSPTDRMMETEGGAAARTIQPGKSTPNEPTSGPETGMTGEHSDRTDPMES